MNLAHRAFVDFYYTDNDFCKLYLYLSHSGVLLGTLGRELMRFEYKSTDVPVRIGSNWHSLQQGIGGQLSKFSAQANPGRTALMFIGSRDTVRILRHYDWVFIPGITGYFLNGPCILFPGFSRWKRAANSVIRRTMGQPIPAFVSRIPLQAAGICIREERSYSDDLLPRRSPFTFRFAPSIEHLRWRYNLALEFVRYRLFRVIAQGISTGYVIINEGPQRLLVAQCDGEDMTALAYGILLSILQVGRNDKHIRTVFLACCHQQMRLIFEQFGFQTGPRARYLPFAFRFLPVPVEDRPDTRNWLVNYDWADNGLLPPFLTAA